jgi:rhodanese-related sulfurtransferase/DNA-binding transcriptional ArsR family regulator
MEEFMSDARKTDLYDGLARVGHALGSGRRLELLDLLAQGPRGVADLAAAAGLKLTTASAHLQTLRRAGLVRTRRAGTSIHYALADDDVAALYVRLREVATARLPDVDRARHDYLGTTGGADTEEVGRAELLRRAGAGEVVVLDVRPVAEYRAGHVPGAVCIPIDELAARLDELPADTEVVAYCRGAFCVFAHDAVRLLRAAGRRAVRLEEGMLEWRLAAYPVSA